jgi:8-oxo-dGTP pyrophosphatase MutT (NUDIX family)
MQPEPHGKIDQSSLNRKNDYLYRISIKSLIKNDLGQVLVVKESGRTWWDLPGGGMDHGEDIKSAIARELNEEVKLEGGFDYEVVGVEDPAYLPNANMLQVRLIFAVYPKVMPQSAGSDADEIKYIDPDDLKDSDNLVERNIYRYANSTPNTNFSTQDTD